VPPLDFDPLLTRAGTLRRDNGSGTLFSRTLQGVPPAPVAGDIREKFPGYFVERKKVGGRGRDRTGGPLLAKQVLSQLSYTPTCNHMIVMDFLWE
jgi:hypothetical protein